MKDKGSANADEKAIGLRQDGRSVDQPSLDTLHSFVCCPFCGEEDFDLIGLKSHLQHGDCEPFENTELMSRVFVRAFNAANAQVEFQEGSGAK